MILNTPTTNFKALALDDVQLRAAAPSIFATGPMQGLSARYTFVPTTEIVAGLRAKHWLPVAVEEQRSRREARRGFQKHLLRFRRAEQMETLDEWNAELVLTNSHDAGCAYVLQVGIYRRLCSNGLVVSDEQVEGLRFRHAGLRAEEVVQASYRILDGVPGLAAAIDRFRNRVLSEPEALAFAQQALRLRYETPELSPIAPQTLLSVRRPEDQAQDLWTLLNKVQEHLCRGGLADGHRDRHGHLRTLRGLRGIDSKVALNQGLWNLASAVIHGVN